MNHTIANGHRLCNDEENAAGLIEAARTRAEIRAWNLTRNSNWVIGLRETDRPTHTTCEPDLRII